MDAIPTRSPDEMDLDAAHDEIFRLRQTIASLSEQLSVTETQHGVPPFFDSRSAPAPSFPLACFPPSRPQQLPSPYASQASDSGSGSSSNSGQSDGEDGGDGPKPSFPSFPSFSQHPSIPPPHHLHPHHQQQPPPGYYPGAYRGYPGPPFHPGMMPYHYYAEGQMHPGQQWHPAHGHGGPPPGAYSGGAWVEQAQVNEVLAYLAIPPE